MNEKAGSRDLDDDDIIDISSDESRSPSPAAPRRKKTAVKTEQPEPDLSGPIARRPASDRLTTVPRTSRTTRNASQDFLAHITTALDPATSAARGEERSARSLQATQIFTLTSQLRDTQSMLETLRNRLAETDRERQTAERRADRAELMSMMSQSQSRHFHGRNHSRSHSPVRRGRRDRSQARAAPRSRRYRQDVMYADGGQATLSWGPEDSPPLQEDSPGTRRFTHEMPLPLSSPEQNSPVRHHDSFRRPSPFRSAMSGLNHVLNSPIHRSSGPSTSTIPPRHQTPQRHYRRTSTNDFAVTVTPSRAGRAGVSVVVTPGHENHSQVRDEEALN